MKKAIVLEKHHWDLAFEIL